MSDEEQPVDSGPNSAIQNLKCVRLTKNKIIFAAIAVVAVVAVIVTVVIILSGNSEDKSSTSGKYQHEKSAPLINQHASSTSENDQHASSTSENDQPESSTSVINQYESSTSVINQHESSTSQKDQHESSGTQADQCKGNPLLLTPLLTSGQTQLARQQSQVNDPLVYNGKSYSGYLTVDPDLGNHMFFWYFPSTKDPDAPLLLWLNGGPGITSMQGLFLENGPLILDESDSGPLAHRTHSWVDKFHMLYIDNPVGVGFSFSENGTKGERVTQQLYTEDLYRALVQFYQIFPELGQTDLYLGGQSYAGRYVPALAYRVHIGNENGEAKLPLTGIYIGGPYFSPEDAANGFFNFKYKLGYISGSDLINSRKLIKNMFISSSKGDKIDIGRMYKVLYDFQNPINIPGSYDNFVTGETIPHEKLTGFLNNGRLKTAIHAGCRQVISFKLPLALVQEDLLSNTKAQMSLLVNKYKVLIFNGDYDIVTSSSAVESQILSLAWDLLDEYKNTTRQVWKGDNKEVIGYFSKIGQFCRVIVHGAGHQVPRDKPEVSLKVMTQFVQNGCISIE